MSTASIFSQRLEASDIPQPAKAVGAHLAAKLQLFSTDERTLTDELCDMLCLWLGMQAHQHSTGSLLGPSFTLTLSKTTAAKEVETGADLELIVSSPLGHKRCLMQAKVLDPFTGRLRCDSAAGWKKLRTQLAAARKEAGDRAYLLIYVPGALLDGTQYGYSTYEQDGHFCANGSRPAYYGATLIAVDDLLGKTGRWRSTKRKVAQTSPGRFMHGVPFWRFLLELLFCRRAAWSFGEKTALDRSRQAAHTLTVKADEITADGWRELQEVADLWLPEDPENKNDGDEA